jgi:hypothetical protein
VATRGLQRRDLLRGQLTALTEKAGDLGVREREDVDRLIGEIEQRLWVAPSHLARARERLLELSNLLNEPPGAEGGQDR